MFCGNGKTRNLVVVLKVVKSADPSYPFSPVVVLCQALSTSLPPLWTNRATVLGCAFEVQMDVFQYVLASCISCKYP